MNANPPISNAREAALLDHLATAVICVDGGLKVSYVNAASEQLLGLSQRKALGKRLPKVLHIPDSLLRRLIEAVDSGQPYTDRQTPIELAPQDTIVVDCSISPFRTESGDNGLVVEMAAIDRPLRIARDEAILVQQEHARSLLRGLAHEIKNPLGGLRGAAQLLQKQLPDEDLQDYTSIIIREADRLQSLIDRMLGPANRPNRHEVNIHEVLEHVRKIVQVGAPSEVKFPIDYDPSIPEFISDRDRLVQVFLNIAGNALQAIGNKGSISFRSRINSNFTIAGKRHKLIAEVEIADDGPGVPSDIADQIFYPMVTGTDNGTGLGLSIAQSIMNQMGGLIECHSEPGDTRFTVLIPLEIV